MEGLIPDEIVDRVRSSVDIVELISEHVSLKKSGANYIGRCPFHEEKTPSFSVSPAKQIFHCFGCGAGGDAVGFLIRKESFTFPEAVRRLAERAGIEVPERSGRGPGAPKGETEALLKANVEAMEYFAWCLSESKVGEKARQYLAGRGMAGEVVKEYSLGVSPAGWDGLIKRFEKMGVGHEVAERAGLAVKKSSGQGCYDRFRDRLMFPIRDARGRVIGFGGRAMGDEEPKYLNSPETPLFKKGETLYLLDVAAEHIRKKGFSVITEGYFDAIACHKAGVRNAVATLGTALTPAHLRLLGRLSKNVLLVFDSDKAGLKAAERSLEVFLGTDLTAKVALLPEGDDPDSLVKRAGAEALAERLKKSEHLMDFVIERLAHGAEAIEDKVAAASAITALLARVGNGVLRSHYLLKAAEELGVQEGALLEELNKKLGGTVAGGARRQAFAATNRIEEDLLRIVLRYPEVALKVKEKLSPVDFTDSRFRGLAAKVFERMAEDGKISLHGLLDSLTDEGEKDLVRKLSFPRHTSLTKSTLEDIVDNIAGDAKDAIDKLLKGRMDRRVEELHRLIKVAEEKKDSDLSNKLLKELIECQKKKS